MRVLHYYTNSTGYPLDWRLTTTGQWEVICYWTRYYIPPPPGLLNPEPERKTKPGRKDRSDR